jgi:hypothetical protein
LHANVHALVTHAGVALATPVVQTFPHVLQLLTLLVVSTHVLPHSVGVEPEQPDTHVDPEHAGVLPLQAWLHMPQLFLSVLVSTHAPLQSVYPLLHVKVHALFTHAAWALATLVEQTFPQVLQSFRLLVVSTQVPPQSAGVEPEQPEVHEAPPASPPEAEQTGVPPVHALPQLPQLVAVVSFTQAPLHIVYPALHAVVQALLTQTACALATLVLHAVPHVLQLFVSLVVSTHEPLHSMGVAGGQFERHENVLPELAHTSFAAHAFAHPPQLAAVE